MIHISGKAIDIAADYLLGGGSHLAKVSTVLDWLNEPSNGADNELVVMMDAYGRSLERSVRLFKGLTPLKISGSN